VSIEPPVLLDASHIDAALALSDEAGWNQTAADWAIFLRNGQVFGTFADSQLVATAAALPYGESFGWVSMVLVTRAWRRQGLATRLVQAATDALTTTGRAALLDATEAGTAVYARMGFVGLCSMARWEGSGGALGGAGGACNLSPDRRAFGADRAFLLDDFLARPGSSCFAAKESFAILRAGRRAVQIGPVVGAAVAGALLHAAIDAATGPAFADILEAGEPLLAGLAERGWREQRRFTRMIFGGSGLPGEPALLAVAAGPEFG
jgi:GNAT superfamily N-acetyltransferase